MEYTIRSVFKRDGTVLGTAFDLLSAAYSAVLGLYGAELFPTKLRASATNRPDDDDFISGR